MNNYTKTLQKELDDTGLLPLFEIAVKDKNGNEEWISCDIDFQGNSIVAQRDAVSDKESKSKFIATTKFVVDNCLSLDEHLQELHGAIVEDIENGNLYTMDNER